MRGFRGILNFFLTGFVLWAAASWYPENVYIDNTKTLILVTVLMFALNWAFSFFMMASAFTVPLGVGCIGLLIGWIAAFFLNPIKLFFVDAIVPDFHLTGFWTYVLLSVVLSIFTLRAKVKVETNKKEVAEDA